MMGRRTFMAAVTAATSGAAWAVSQPARTPMQAACTAAPLLVFADTALPPQAPSHCHVMARDALLLSQPTQLHSLLAAGGRIAGIGPSTDIFVAAGLLQGTRTTLEVVNAAGQLQRVALGAHAQLDASQWLALSPAQLAEPAWAHAVMGALRGTASALPPAQAHPHSGAYFAWTLSAAS